MMTYDDLQRLQSMQIDDEQPQEASPEDLDDYFRQREADRTVFTDDDTIAFRSYD